MRLVGWVCEKSHTVIQIGHITRYHKISQVLTHFARKENNIKIDSVEDMKRHKIGTIRDDMAEQHLVNVGISLDDMDRVAETMLNIKKLNRGRIDLWAYGENVAMWEFKANGFDPADYESVHELGSKSLYVAFHKDTLDAVIAKLQAALDSIKADGEYDKILDRY